MKHIIFLCLLVVSPFAYPSECELTDEYKQARSDVARESREIHSTFNECRDSMRTGYYWKAVAACKKEGLGSGIGGGCGHLVMQGSYPSENPDVSHCEIFKVSKEIEVQYRQELMGKINVQKCKT